MAKTEKVFNLLIGDWRGKSRKDNECHNLTSIKYGYRKTINNTQKLQQHSNQQDTAHVEGEQRILLGEEDKRYDN